MDPDRTILCGSNSYEKSYYFNEEYASLPEAIKQELKILCVLYTEEVSGILIIEFDNFGNLLLQVSSRENDMAFDDIGSDLKIKEIRREKKELLEALETFHKVFCLGQEL